MKEAKSDTTKPARKAPAAKKNRPAAKGGAAKKKTAAPAKRTRPAPAGKQTVSRGKSPLSPPQPEQVAVAAYFKFQSRVTGGASPDPVADWYDAEAELTRSSTLQDTAASR